MTRQKRWFATALLAVVYYQVARTGLSLAFVHPSATAVWPPTGIALAMLVLCGRWLWPAIFAGALAINLTLSNPATALGIAAGNTLEAVAGAYLVGRFAGGATAFEKPERVLSFAVLAGLVSTMIAAGVGVTSLCLGGDAPWSRWGTIALTWWMGDAGGALVVTPALVLWSQRPSLRPDRGRALEAALLLVAVIVVGGAVFHGMLPMAEARYPLEFLCLPLLVWAAFRFGPRETATLTLVLSGIAVLGTLRGFGPFSREGPAVALLLLQACLGTISVMSLALSAAVLQQRREHEAVLDAQERVRALERQRAAQEMLARSLENFPAMIWRCDPEGNCDYVNKPWLAFTGRRIEQERGDGWLEAVHPADQEGSAAAWQQAFGARQPFERQYRLRRHDGEYRWVEDHALPITGADGSFAGYIGGCFDVTERKQHEEAKSRFIANAAHELRTPVTAIVALSDLLGTFRGDLTEAQFTEHCRLLEEQGIRLRRLISSLLDLSRIEQGMGGLERQLVGVASVARRALEAAPPPNGASVRLAVPEELLVVADGLRLEQVLVNLLTNAWRYGGPAVTLEARAYARDVLVVVGDDGEGVAAELLPHLFEPFARGPGARTSDGCGLGLAITRGIVQALGGAVWYEPAWPRGSRFVVRLPRAA
jgi:PAS domain S-box-containing protein